MMQFNVNAKLADRGRVVSMRKEQSDSTNSMNSRVYGKRTKPLRMKKELSIEGPKYRGKDRWEAEMANHLREDRDRKRDSLNSNSKSRSLRGQNSNNNTNGREAEDFGRELGSQLSGCCSGLLMNGCYSDPIG